MAWFSCTLALISSMPCSHSLVSWRTHHNWRFAYQVRSPPSSRVFSLSGNPPPDVSCTSGHLNTRLLGVGSCVPDVELTNSDLAEVVDTSDKWIMQRTGISQRNVMSPTQSLRDIASGAAVNALQSAGIEPSEVDLVILATSSPDDLFGDASAVAARVGASAAVAFDLTAACSGFLFAVVTGAQYLQTGTYSTALIIGADALSRWVDWSDRNTCVLFGDGAGAIVLQKGNEPGILGFELKSNGRDHEHLCLAYSGRDNVLDTSRKHRLTRGTYSPVSMNGREVYKFATREVPVVIEHALRNAGITAQQIDWLLLHQANIRIIETVADRLGLSHTKIISNLSEHGNTSAGSIPLALDTAVKSGQVQPGDIIACAGFGAGLTWGAAIFRWD
eukprot:CAMPEP_0197431026 /NCGR_PEP_ID=MMETSP1170-20131217/52948_1 /TAXON_ID=54406 /ORGANISM="Sarcinochrysis sp, Strain CCMP770" /LENGTH=388 /DNA_ID=CAMNT_0042958965 /DNA_START=148 /DNA_END=1314 /DNA_ORIENTATION=+